MVTCLKAVFSSAIYMKIQGYHYRSGAYGLTSLTWFNELMDKVAEACVLQFELSDAARALATQQARTQAIDSAQSSADFFAKVHSSAHKLQIARIGKCLTIKSLLGFYHYIIN